MSKNIRIVQIMPTACPLWGVYAIEEPDPDGYHYWCERVHGLALTEEWERRGPFDSDDSGCTDNRERSIHPIYIEDSYFDTPDAFGYNGDSAFKFIEGLPVTQAERDKLEAAAVDTLQTRTKVKEIIAQRQLEKVAAAAKNHTTSTKL